MKKARRQENHEAQLGALFLNLAEQVKTPFVQISYAAEMLQSERSQKVQEQLRQDIAVTSKSALRLIDGYLLSVELQREAVLTLESVSVSSVLYEAANSLSDFAKVNGCTVELAIEGKFGPVMGHRQALLSAVVGLGYSLIEACTKLRDNDKPKVRLAVSRTAKGFRTGVYVNKVISRTMLTQARSIAGFSHQPFSPIVSHNGSGILIADSLFSLLDAPLTIARNHGYHGFAATLMPSRQLRLV